MWREIPISLLAFFSLCFVGVGCTQPAPMVAEAATRGDQTVEAAGPAQEVGQQEPVVEREAPVIPPVTSDELAMRLELPDVVERVMPSVVGIATERTVRRAARGLSPFDDPFFRQFGPFFGPGPQAPQQPREHTQQGIGSGVIVDAAGVVVTNHHVIDGADTIRLNLSDGRELVAEVAGQDPASDLAVLRIIDPPEDLQAIQFADSDGLRLGQSVIAIGNPFGLSGSVTLGIISAKGRGNVGLVDYEDFIQTDAAINPGNSGGALLNLRGELVGINTAILTRSGGYQGIGFAIPSNMVEMVITGLLEDGRVDRGWLGVMLQALTPDLAEALGVESSLRGVVVSDVQPESPAARAGLQRGDVVISLAGQSVRTPGELRNLVGLRSPGSTVALAVVRDGERRTLEVVLGSQEALRPVADEGGQEAVTEDAGIAGLRLRGLNPELRREHRVPEAIRDGVVVLEVEFGTEAERLGLRPGDVILEVNRRPVRSGGEVAAAYREGQRNLLLLYRDGATIFMTR